MEHNLITVIREEFDRLVEKLEVVVNGQQDMLKDHENRIRHVEKYLMGALGGYSALLTLFTLWKEFIK